MKLTYLTRLVAQEANLAIVFYFWISLSKLTFLSRNTKSIIFYLTVAFIGLLVVAACSEQPPLQRYYFPGSNQVYVYSANDSIGKEYWMFDPLDNGIWTQVFNGRFQKSQESQESFYSNGVNLEKLTLFANGKQTDAEIESGFVFPFTEIDSSEVVFYRIKWTVDAGDSLQTTYELVRNRRFAGYEDWDVMGVNTRCAKFNLDELIISDMDGSIELKTKGIEYYAPNIGLVYRKRQMTEELLIEQRLLEVISVEEFDLRRGE